MDPYGIARASEKAREWTDARNRRIRTASEEGVSLRDIGQWAGLTHTAIAKIVAK